VFKFEYTTDAVMLYTDEAMGNRRRRVMESRFDARIHDKQYQLQSEVALHADEICETRTSDEDRANPKENRVYVIKGTPEAEINGLGAVRECRSLQITTRRRVQQSCSHSARACNDDTTRNESGFTTVCLNATNERLTLLDFSCKW